MRDWDKRIGLPDDIDKTPGSMFSVEKRHQIYKKAYDWFKENRYGGICRAMIESDRHLIPVMRGAGLCIHFPELTSFKPVQNYWFSYWFPARDICMFSFYLPEETDEVRAANDKRLEILSQCIEMTKPKHE